MKTITLRLLLPLGVATLALTLFGCPNKHGRSGDEGPHGLVLLPEKTDGADHQNIEKHWREIDEILHKDSGVDGVDRKKLFRLRKYVPGQPPVDDPKDGALDETMLIEEVKEADARALDRKFKGHAIQIGLGVALDYQAVPPGATPSEESASSPPPETGGGGKMPQAHFRANIVESDEMVHEVNDVLEGKPTPTPSPH